MQKQDKDRTSIKKAVSIIIPVFNEAEIIESVVRDFYIKIMQKNPEVEFIIAEDGSTDGTKEILKRLNKEVPFKLVSGKERKGYTRAFKDAVQLANKELVFFSDSDGQHEPNDLFKLLKEIDSNDIVSGYKLKRRDPFHRLLISKVYNFFIFLLFGLKMKDINSGFKLIKKDVIDDVLNDVINLKYCVVSEFILKSYLAGYKIKEVPIDHYPRKSGATVVFNPAKLPFIVFEMIKDILRMKVIFLTVKNK